MEVHMKIAIILMSLGGICILFGLLSIFLGTPASINVPWYENIPSTILLIGSGIGFLLLGIKLKSSDNQN